MSKIIDWAMDALGLSDGIDDEVAEEVGTEKEKTEKKRFSRFSKNEKADIKEVDKTEETSGGYTWSKPSYASEARRSKVVNMSGTSSSMSTSNMVIQQPTEYNNAKEIARNLKDRQPVIVNLEKLDKVTAQKVVDFLSGAVFALDGRIQKVSNGIIVAVPSNMGITGYISDEIPSSLFAELDF